MKINKDCDIYFYDLIIRSFVKCDGEGKCDVLDTKTFNELTKNLPRYERSVITYKGDDYTTQVVYYHPETKRKL